MLSIVLDCWLENHLNFCVLFVCKVEVKQFISQFAFYFSHQRHLRSKSQIALFDMHHVVSIILFPSDSSTRSFYFCVTYYRTCQIIFFCRFTTPLPISHFHFRFSPFFPPKTAFFPQHCLHGPTLRPHFPG